MAKKFEEVGIECEQRNWIAAFPVVIASRRCDNNKRESSVEVARCLYYHAQLMTRQYLNTISTILNVGLTIARLMLRLHKRHRIMQILKLPERL